MQACLRHACLQVVCHHAMHFHAPHAPGRRLLHYSHCALLHLCCYLLRAGTLKWSLYSVLKSLWQVARYMFVPSVDSRLAPVHQHALLKRLHLGALQSTSSALEAGCYSFLVFCRFHYYAIEGLMSELHDMTWDSLELRNNLYSHHPAWPRIMAHASKLGSVESVRGFSMRVLHQNS